MMSRDAWVTLGITVFGFAFGFTLGRLVILPLLTAL